MRIPPWRIRLPQLADLRRQSVPRRSAVTEMIRLLRQIAIFGIAINYHALLRKSASINLRGENEYLLAKACSPAPPVDCGGSAHCVEFLRQDRHFGPRADRWARGHYLLATYLRMVGSENSAPLQTNYDFISACVLAVQRSCNVRDCVTQFTPTLTVGLRRRNARAYALQPHEGRGSPNN